VVSSKEILEKTGIKSGITLTRWHKQGFIPPPLVRTHPSGRGKMGYWPDWVLERCIGIVRMRRQGYTVREATMLLDLEKTREEFEEDSKEPFITDELEKKSIKLRSGRKVSLLDIFVSFILEELRPLITERSIRDAIVTRFKQQKGLDLALNLFDAGYNPILWFDGINLEIVPDFLVGHLLSYKPASGRAHVVVQLLKPLEKAFSMLDKKLEVASLAYPAPLIRIKKGEALVEYDFVPTGILGFELIQSSARTIGGGNNKSKDKEVFK